MSLLDSILANTRDEIVNTGNIISVNNDVNSIDYGGESAIRSAGGGRPSGPWDAAEYGISLEEAQARWDAAQTPEAREKVIAELKQRAIARAGLDTTGGIVRVFVAGATPWHKLGTNVAHAVDSLDAERLAGLNFTVSKRLLSYVFNERDPFNFSATTLEDYKEQDDVFALVRDDTGAYLGAVGSRYQIIQNKDAFKFMDIVLQEYGARYSTAGSLFGGKKVWMLADMPKQSFKVAQGDETVCYAIFTNPHDGSGKAYCYPTTERVVCANTLRMSLGKDASKGIGIRHTGDIKAKIVDARQALGLSVKVFDEFKQTATLLAGRSVNALGGPKQYTDDVLDEVLDISAAEVALGAEEVARQRCADRDVTPDDFAYCVKQCEKEITSRGEILDDIIKRFESERCNVHGIGGTAWAVLQSVTEHADYANGKRHVGTPNAQASRKFESVLAGDADQLKQVALQVAVKALAV